MYWALWTLVIISFARSGSRIRTSATLEGSDKRIKFFVGLIDLALGIFGIFQLTR